MVIPIYKSNHLKAIAILMMLCLHLFNREYHGLFQPLIFIGSQPLSYYISLFCDACVPIFAFVSGYGLYYKYIQTKTEFRKGNYVRLKKLYINYWVVLVLFAVVLGLIMGKSGYPGSLGKFILNFSGLETSYNGAWWFFTTYVFFVLTANFWFRLLDKINPYVYLICLGGIYVISFYFRMYQNNIFENVFLNYLHKQSALYFCTLFQFMLGAFFLKYNWNKQFQSFLPQRINFNVLGIFGIIALIIIHGFIPNFIIAPFTALGFIFIFINLDIPAFINKCLDFFAKHATNLWLIHMFFYMIYFPEFIYKFKYPIFIFSALVIMCVMSSYMVNSINKMILKWV